jgi:hypothetical protein
VTGAADSNANVIFGAVIDEAMGDDVRVTAIATGFGGRPRRRRVEAAAASQERPAIRAPSVTDVEIDIPSFLKDDGPPDAAGRRTLPGGGAALRDRLTTLAARTCGLAAWPYPTYCPARLALGSLASAAPATPEQTRHGCRRMYAAATD